MQFFPFISVNAPQEEGSATESILLIFPQLTLINTATIHDVSNGVNIRFVSRILWVHSRISDYTVIQGVQSDHQVLLNFEGM